MKITEITDISNIGKAHPVVLLGILNALGFKLMEYREEGKEVDTSHGRSYWSEGTTEYKVERITPLDKLLHK